MTVQPNINSPSHLHYQALVIQVLYPLLRRLNAGTLSIVLMIALALLNAVRGTESGSREAPDGSRVWLKTATLPGVQEITCFRQPPQSRISTTHQQRSKSTGENN
jgi:hypothetical protein